MKRNILYIICLILPVFAFAENQIITGKISDFDSNQPLIGVTIKLEGTGKGAVSKTDGTYEILNIMPGNYNLLIKMIGYQSITQEVNIKSNTTKLDFKLKYQPFETSEIIVSANKRVQNVQDVPISVSTLTANILELRMLNRVDEALRLVPGVNLNKDNVNVRGSSGFAFGVGSRVLLLLDGFPLIAGDNGDIKFDAIPLINIERIEVVKGAGSALYGSSALGGIINIITREPREKLDVAAKSYIGFYTEPRHQSWKYTDELRFNKGLEFSLLKKFGDFGANISAGLIQDDSYKMYDDSKRYFVLGRFGYDFSDNFNIKFNAHLASDDKADWINWSSLDSALVPPSGTDLTSRIKSNKLNLNSDINYIINSKNFLNLKAGIFRTDYSTYSDLVDSSYRNSEATAINLEIQYNSVLYDNLFLTSGLNFTKNDVVANVYGSNNQSIYAAYSQLEYTPFHGLIFTLGGRYDHERVEELDDQSQISPKFGVSFTGIDNLSLRASYGSGFRAPKAAERFSNLKAGGFDIIQNLNLKSERSQSFEVGGKYDFILLNLPLSVDLALFSNHFEDLIEPTFVTSDFKAVIQFLNVTKARINGVELSLKAMLFQDLGFETSVTYTDPMDLTLNEVLKYRSKYLWYNHLFYTLDKFTINMDYRYISRPETIDERLGLQVLDHDARVDAHVVDLSLTLNLKSWVNQDIRASLHAKNLFDYYYTEMTGNLAATRFLGFELRYNY